jgi:hypothetical protein
MTPDDLIDELWKLVKDGRFREAVDLAMLVIPDIRSQMTADHAVRLHEVMHIADIDDVPVAPRTMQPQTEAQAQPSRRS